MNVRFCDEFEHGFGWIAAEPPWMQRASHAVVVDGRVWVVDPVEGEGVEERVRALGEPAGVVQLLDRHARDSASFAARLGVPFHALPFDGLPGTPFDVIPVVNVPRWRELALWWADAGVLVCADAVGTAPYYLAPGERLAVSPLLRLTPPRALRGLAPRHLLVGHGDGIHGEEATAALATALGKARGRFPGWLVRRLRRGAG